MPSPLKISDISETDEEPAVEIFFPDGTGEVFFPHGTSEVFTGKDADEIIDRGEALASARAVLLTRLNKLATDGQSR